VMHGVGSRVRQRVSAAAKGSGVDAHGMIAARQSKAVQLQQASNNRSAPGVPLAGPKGGGAR
jgi:hypothetical protein